MSFYDIYNDGVFCGARRLIAEDYLPVDISEEEKEIWLDGYEEGRLKDPHYQQQGILYYGIDSCE